MNRTLTFFYAYIILALLGIPSISQAQTSFNNVSPSLGLTHICFGEEMGGGCAFLDFNNDGWQDIYVTGEGKADVLYQNNGNGTFTDISASAGIGMTDSINTIGVAAGDIDNDGYPEIFVSTARGFNSLFFKNNGNGTLTEMAIPAGMADTSWNYSATFGDYNQDGLLDLYVGNYMDQINFLLDSNQNFAGMDHTCNSNHLYLNNGNNTFTDIINTLSIGDTACNLATTFTDYDNDGDLDLYNGNDFGEWETPNNLYRNEFPLNTFTDVSVSSGMNQKLYSMGIAIGDYDQDLDLDYYVTNMGRNILMKNLGNGTFIDTATAAGVENEWVVEDSLKATGWGTSFMDIDNDTYLDLFVVNGYIEAFEPVWLFDPDKLYYNNGDGTFADISDTAGVSNTQMSRGFAFADFDNDGDNDLLVIPIKDIYLIDSVPILLYQNNLNNNNNWLEVKLQGTVSNRDAIGAHMIIYVGGKSWLHEVMPSGSHGSQNGLVAHFGLGTNNIVDSLHIIWPNGGQQTEYNLAANQLLTIVEGNFNAQHLIKDSGIDLAVFPNPSSSDFTLQFQLKEPTAVSIEMSNLLGQVIWSKTMIPNKEIQQLSLSAQELQLSAGIYNIALKTNEKIITKKIQIL